MSVVSPAAGDRPPAHIVVIDKAANRLDAAKNLGADMTLAPERVAQGGIRALTGGVGADVAIEAVGSPDPFELCTDLVRSGGTIANVGVHGKPATLHLETLWSRDVTITTGLVDTSSTARLLDMVAGGLLDVSALVTYRFPMEEVDRAYDVFASPARTGALKVLLTR